MSKHRTSPKAMCPFYRHEDRQMIYCEGFCEGTVIHVSFAVASDAYRYKNEFCRSIWRGCPIALLLEKIYEDKKY